MNLLDSQFNARNEAALAQALADHLRYLGEHWSEALTRFGFDGAWLSAGEEHFHFQDDHGPKFKPNPHFAQWVDPQFICPGSHLWIRPGKPAVLFLHTPADYWHAPAPLPQAQAGALEIQTFDSQEALVSACQKAAKEQSQLAYIGEEHPHNEQLGQANPIGLLNYLFFHRARKTPYELIAMRAASEVGVAGHLAAAQSFAAGGTEFDIHMAYLAGSNQTEVDLPYGNIVALNEHASTLHYQLQQRKHTSEPRSLLIDAGGTYRGYASDITRTYAAERTDSDDFAQLIELMDQHQRQLINSISTQRTYADLHEQMHRQLAEILAKANLVDCSAEAAFTQGITEKFCPHGLGHLLGLQVHDVGGHLGDENGTPAPPAENYPALRFTRNIEVDQVFTVEPGLYFIPMLLAELRTAKAPINWPKVEQLAPYGGIRIEDNVRVLAEGVENLTRDAFAQVHT